MTPVQQKKLLVVLLTVLVIVTGYRVLTADKQRTAPLTYTRGAVARSSVRSGIQARSGGNDSLHAFLARREEKYPGVRRDLFRMENPEAAKPQPVIRTAPTPSVFVPPVPEKTPEEIAAEASRADLSRFRFLGFLTDKESSLFLAKDGETYIVRSGDTVLRNYRVKEAGKEYVILVDTVTRVEVRIELSGGAEPAAVPHQRYR